MLVSSFGVAALRGRASIGGWLSGMSWVIPTQVALAPVAICLAQLIASVGSLGLGLVIVPLLVARQYLYQRYVRLRNAYLVTIRSLAAAIEAKDPYTQGHSVRVSEYSVAIARAMHLSENVVERVELAGLLHDLGKVGVTGSFSGLANSAKTSTRK